MATRVSVAERDNLHALISPRQKARRRRRAPSELLRAWLITDPQLAPEPDTSPRTAIATTALTSLAALSFGLLAQVMLIGTLQHNRDQQIAYDDLRLALAEGTTPVGPVEGGGPEKGEPIARLSIPAIGLKEVVLEGTTSTVLRSGVGHRRDTVYPGQVGNSVVMGRRLTYGGPFAKVGSLQAGDEMQVTSGQGQSTFRVSAVREPGDMQRSVGGARLTLITTSGSRFAPSDVVRVDADLVGTPFPAATPAFTSATLPAAERELQGEHHALRGVVAWAILLIAAAVGKQWLRIRWGRWQTWLIAIPTLGLLGITVADHIARLLPNLL